MLHHSKKSFLALEAVLYVACHASVQPVNAKEVCAQQGVSQRYLEPVMQRLVNSGILRSVRGPRGGYVLARDRRKISLADILRVIAETEGREEIPHSSLQQVLEPVMDKLESLTGNYLETITLDSLCRQAEQSAISRSKKESTRKSDFVI